MTFSKHRYNVHEIVSNSHISYIIQTIGSKGLHFYPEGPEGGCHPVILHCILLTVVIATLVKLFKSPNNLTGDLETQ